VGNNSIGSQKIEKIRRDKSLVDLAYDRIRNEVITGHIQQGKRLNQLQLAEDLGVSQRTVREALARLVSEGLATHEPHKGVRVVSLPLHELEEIYELRALLEGLAVELAVNHVTSRDIARMRRLLPVTVPSGRASSIGSVRQANHDFHWVAIEASGNKHLIRLLKQLWEMVLISALPKAEDRQQDSQAHKELVEALEARNGKKARKLVERHVLQTLDLHRK